MGGERCIVEFGVAGGMIVVVCVGCRAGWREGVETRAGDGARREDGGGRTGGGEECGVHAAMMPARQGEGQAVTMFVRRADTSGAQMWPLAVRGPSGTSKTAGTIDGGSRIGA